MTYQVWRLTRSFFSSADAPWHKQLQLIDANLPQKFEVAEHFSGAEHDRSQRIVGDGDRQTGFFANALIEIFEQKIKDKIAEVWGV